MPTLLPRLYLVADGPTARRLGVDIIQIVESALAAGVRLVQWRDKESPPEEVYRMGLELAQLTAAAGAQFDGQ